MARRVRLIACAAVLLCQPCALAQEGKAYVGGSAVLHTQPHAMMDADGSNPEPLGGTTWGASVLVGTQLSPRLAMEFEPCFSGAFSHEYSYQPGPSWSAHEVDSRRDTFFAFQLRTRVAGLEPIVGVGYV